MPKVSTYRPSQVRTEIAQQPLMDAAPGVSLSRANQRQTQGALALAGSIVDASRQIKARTDTTSARDAMVSFERSQNELFFDPDSGYFNTEGKNAYDNAESANKALDGLKKHWGEGLNSDARALFDRAADTHITRSRADIARHASRGLKSWEVATVKSKVTNTIQSASLYWNQPDRLKVQNALGRQSVIDAAEMEGVGAEVTGDRLKIYDSSFAKAAVSSAVDSSSDAGKKAMEQYGSQLDGPDKAKLEKEIAAKAQAEKLQTDSQQAMASGVSLVNTYDSREDIREQVNKIEDPELRKKTMSEAMRQFNLKKQGESEDQARSFEEAESHVIDGGSAETFQATDPEGWQRLSAKQKQSILSGKPVQTNWNVFSTLMVLPSDQLAKVNPTDFFHELAPEQRNRLIGAVKSAKGTASSREKTEHQVGRTQSAQVTSAIEQMFGDKKRDWSDNDIKKANAFYDLLDGEVKHREDQKGSALSTEEFTDTLNDLTRGVTVEGFFFDSDEDVTDIPQADMRSLSKFLRDRGIPVTSENLIKAQQQASQ